MNFMFLLKKVVLLYCLSLCFADSWAIAEVLRPISPYWKTTGNSERNSGTNFISTTTNISLRFNTNSTDLMVTDSSGFVGLGKVSSIQRLDVWSNFCLSKAFIPKNNSSFAKQLLISGGANNPPAGSPFTFGNPSAAKMLAKYYSILSRNGNWNNGIFPFFTINDSDCLTSSSTHFSFTSNVGGLLDDLKINNVQTTNSYFIVTAYNRTGFNLPEGIAISFITFY